MCGVPGARQPRRCDVVRRCGRHDRSCTRGRLQEDLTDASAVLHLLKAGDEVISSDGPRCRPSSSQRGAVDDVYGGTRCAPIGLSPRVPLTSIRRLFTRACGELYSLTFHFVDLSDAELDRCLNKRTRLVW